MDLKEWQGFVQEEFVALDVQETLECGDEDEQEEGKDFGPDNK